MSVGCMLGPRAVDSLVIEIPLVDRSGIESSKQSVLLCNLWPRPS
jgi:hypothetical protein